MRMVAKRRRIWSARKDFAQFFRPLRIESLECRALLALTPQLVTDINAFLVGVSTNFPSVANVNGTAFFAGSDNTNGTELWKKDPLAAAPVLVRDIRPGPGASSTPKYLTNVNGTLFFTATDDIAGTELWKSDGTAAGTVLVRDIGTNPGLAGPRFLTNVGGTLFFSTNDGLTGYNLWKSDGTAAGTMMVKDIIPGPGSAMQRYLTNVGGTLYFSASDSTNGYELWKSDGTDSGTVMVKDIRAGGGSSGPRFLTNANGTLYFSANDGTNGYELWRTDAAAGAVMVANINPGAGVGSLPTFLTYSNGFVFFTANDGTNGVELWRTDNAAGAVLVKDINPTSNTGSNPSSLTDLNGILYFAANDGTNGPELWQSDGSTGGTTIVKDIVSGSSGSSPAILTNVNGKLFFFAGDPTNGTELWSSDGTANGTALVKDIRPGANGSFSSPAAAAVGNWLFFAANDGAGEALWQSDGTASGTVKLAHFTTNSGGALASGTTLESTGPVAFFPATDGVNGYELWKSDGTAGGTTLVKDIRPGAPNSNPRYLTNVNGTLFFTANDGAAGYELWKSDGTSGGTVMVKDIFALSGSSSPRFLTNVNGTLFFFANDGVTGYELWKSDGSPNGTMLVKDIEPSGSSMRGNGNPMLGVVNGNLIFSAYTVANGSELWKSDGTATGTALVKDIVFGGGQSYPRYGATVNGAVFFSSLTQAGPRSLWTTDGTTTGTVQLTGSSFGIAPRYLTNVNGTLFFDATDPTNGYELWKSDGTVAGTVVVKNIRSSSSNSFPLGLANVNGKLLFFANDGVSGYELWTSDGTADGTTLVKDILPGSATSTPQFGTSVDGSLFFSANDGVHGSEPWISDGTAGGTRMIADISPGGSFPKSMRLAGSRLLFTADDSVHGRELWSAPLTYDFGDAPDTYGTTRAADGARHFAIGPQLGPLRDEEADGAPTADATGDNLFGSADEDGLVAASLLAGGTSSVTIDAVMDSGSAKLDAWIDFNHNGKFDPSEKIINSQTVSAGQSQIAIAVPSDAVVGPAVARFRISTAGGLGPTGTAGDGEVEDYVLPIMQDLSVNLGLAPPGGANFATIRKNGDNLEIEDDSGLNPVITVSPLAYTNAVVVHGSTSQSDGITVDYSTGGLFSLPGGIQLDGGGPGSDALTVVGSPTTTVQYVSQGLSLGNAILEVQDSGTTGEIQFTNFQSLSALNIATFEVVGTLNIGGGSSLTVGAASAVKLGTLTNLTGGGIIAYQGGISLGTGQLLRGTGFVNGRLAADIGSTIEATGFLTLGDGQSPAGFATRGELKTNGNTVLLNDANQAVLGTLTTLGTSGMTGTLSSPNGIVLDFGNNIVGFGTLDTPNDVLKQVTNNGSISGDSATNKITVAGYVKGVGSLDNVLVTGTNSPGFSPAKVYYGSVSDGASSKTIAELGGLTAGTNYDQQILSGAADLGGTLELDLLNGYQPTVGDTFTLLSAAGGIHGSYTATALPSLPDFWSWQFAYGATDLKATVVTSRPWHNSLKNEDVTGDKVIATNDVSHIIDYLNSFGQGEVPANAQYGKTFGFLDTTGDNVIATNDVVQVIIYLNKFGAGEGEAAAAASTGEQTSSVDWLALLALDLATQTQKRR